MINKKLISIILLVAFSFVLVHNSVLHHHHDEKSNMSIHEHHHDHDTQDHHTENKETINLFSHFSHFVSTSEFSFTFSDSFDFQKRNIAKLFSGNTSIVFELPQIWIKSEPSIYILIPERHLFYTSYTLRGPPITTVS
jgi:G3E family GTPase